MSGLSTLFQISLYTLAALASLTLALSEGRAFPAAVTLPLALAAFVLTERKRVLRLHPLVANVLGLLAFALAAGELFTGTEEARLEARLTSGAHLLVYLMWIVLFQEKDSKQYWWICALATLQVAVASVMTDSAGFGLLLAGYLFLALWTLSLFSLEQARQRYSATAGTESAGSPTPRVVAAPSLWGRSVARGAIQHDPTERWIGARFTVGVLAMTIMAMLVSSAFFLLIPRQWIGRRAWAFATTDEGPGRSLSGFAEEVRLGDMGRILESTRRVMQVRLYENDGRTGDSEREIGVEAFASRLGYDEPLFRGKVLDEYAQGRWSTERLPSGMFQKIPVPDGATQEITGRLPQGAVRQDIRLEPIGSDVLFAIYPQPVRQAWRAQMIDRSERSRPIWYHPRTLFLMRDANVSTRHAASYEVYSLPTRRGGRNFEGGRRPLRRAFSREYLRLPAGLEPLASEAQRVAGWQAGREPPPRLMADRLVRHLRDTGGFTYSLQAEVRSGQVDPVVDFLERKSGHCEYFASALALMLRAVGIPSRLVSGFKGGTTNTLTGYFEVEERHAHAWVEAMIDGEWIVLDATPPDARLASLEGIGLRLRSWHELKGYLKEVWTSYVVEISLNRQRQQIYEPLRDWAKGSWAAMTGDRRKIAAGLKSFQEFVSSPERWFSWQGGVITFGMLLVGSLIVWALRRLIAAARRVRARLGRFSARRGIRVEFYERFQKLCTARGLARAPAETQREFADAVRRSLDDALRGAGLTQFPAELIDAFYGVRFGDVRLNPAHEDEIDRKLTRLEQALAPRAR